MFSDASTCDHIEILLSSQHVFSSMSVMWFLEMIQYCTIVCGNPAYI